MKKLLFFIPVMVMLAACGGGGGEEVKAPTFEETQKEANAWREKNLAKLSALAAKIDTMKAYVMAVTDSMVTEDSTVGAGTKLAFREKYGEEPYNAEVMHLHELDTAAMGHMFAENDWFENVYDFAKNGYTKKNYEAENNPGSYWAILKEDIEKAGKIEFVILYRTVFRYMPQVKESMFEMGADIENAFLFSMKNGELIRQFNLMGMNDQEVHYNIYEGDDAKTKSSYEAAVKSNFYSKLKESMEKTLKDRFEVKGSFRTIYEYF